MSNEKTSEKSFEESLKELESIVKLLEEGEVPLNDMVSLYEKGAKLGKDCMKMLDNYSEKVLEFSPDKDKQQ